MQLNELIGQAELKKQLSALASSGRMPHALLIEGPTGSGRQTLARLLAQEAVCRCEDVEARPCGVCPDCRKALAGTHPDISFFGGSERARSFSIQTVRALREEAYRPPNEARCRVFVLVNAQALTLEGQNALLRIIEEPPAYLRFILTCRSRFRLLETIRSRTFSLSLSGVSEAEALPLLQSRFPDKPLDELGAALRLFGGCLGPTLEALQGDAWQEGLRMAPALAEALIAPEEWALLTKLNELPARDPVLIAGVLRELRYLFRDALTVKMGHPSYLSPAPETADKLAASVTAGQLTALLDTVDVLEEHQKTNMNHALFITDMSARLRAAVDR